VTKLRLEGRSVKTRRKDVCGLPARPLEAGESKTVLVRRALGLHIPRRFGGLPSRTEVRSVPFIVSETCAHFCRFLYRETEVAWGDRLTVCMATD
jgi:hypothetical protein